MEKVTDDETTPTTRYGEKKNRQWPKTTTTSNGKKQ
jgi:hypothetical protein